MIRVLISGCTGHMGYAVQKACEESEGFSVACGVDILEGASFPYPYFDSFDKVNVPFDVIIDFSSPKAVEGELKLAIKEKKPVVIGSTGLSEKEMECIRKASEVIPVLQSGNMSLGVNLQMDLIKTAAKALVPGYDIEIVERHHRQKKDAPSGTALMLADAISSVLPEKPEYVLGRSEKDKKRTDSEIGFHSVRGGTIVGEHEVSFIGNDEVITITHHAFSKRIFAEGALHAARFLTDKKPGMYAMSDVLA